ncbi:hypothetical protein J7382_09930 [Shimia sp. R11_0]|uniref:hypothetical protein n=1 Tax=Shimia sp. R11_0 TaxID=2821096 RepID=UPI001ADCC7E3|nr:hypothetical protein [Shimia sp. R11_0]MBO9477854.1 hypothetical protein [Shimia sp. R11_0]
MPKWLDGEILFGLFMILVFLAGAYDILSVGGLASIFQDSGIAFALVIIALSVLLLGVVILSPAARNDAVEPSQATRVRPFMTRRGVVIGLVGCAYPILFWAAEYLIATAIVGFVAIGLFTEQFGRKQVTLALCFTVFSYLLFFFFLGITEGDGALISTGLNDKVPTWRRDFFAAF